MKQKVGAGFSGGGKIYCSERSKKFAGTLRIYFVRQLRKLVWSLASVYLILTLSFTIIICFQVTPMDVVKIRLQAQQRPMAAGKVFIYCNGLMDHMCTCPPFASEGKSPKAELWYTRPGKFNGTFVNKNIIFILIFVCIISVY